MQFDNGRPYGLRIEWYENGLKKLEGNLKDGKLDGKVNWLTKNGVNLEGYYKDGVCISGDCD